MIRHYYGDGNQEGPNSYYTAAKTHDSSIIADIFDYLEQNQVETNNRIFSNDCCYNLRISLGIGWQSKVNSVFSNASSHMCQTIQYSILGKALYYYLKKVPTYTFDVTKVSGARYHIYNRVI
jgi:hypothetical protein